MGYDSIEHRQLIQRVIDAGYLNFIERLPHRVMDIVSCLERGEFTYSLPSLPDLFDTSILSRVPCPIMVNEDAIYFLTHVIMFLYDFGIRKPLCLPVKYQSQLQNALGSLLVCMCQEHHWDLLAELLICWDCVKFDHTPIYERSWAELLAVQNVDGSVPGPEWSLKKYKSEAAKSGPSDDNISHFSYHYHTTLVGIIAGCLRLKRKRKPIGNSAAGPTDMRSTVRVSKHQSQSLLRSGFGPPEIKVAIDKGHHWLTTLLKTDADLKNLRPAALCSILMGSWLCAEASNISKQHFIEISREIGNRLIVSGTNSTEEWSNTPATLKIVAAALMRSQDIFLPILHDDSGFVKQVEKVLSKQSTDDTIDELWLTEKRILLHSLGLLCLRTPLDIGVLMQKFQEFSLSASQDDVEKLMLFARSHTLHGVRQQVQRIEYNDINHILSALAMHNLRRYDLTIGCNLLRTAQYFNCDSILSRTCLDYLTLNQRPDGSFGFFGTEERKLMNDKKRSHNVQIELYLPVAIECLWTLAEASGNWRLYNSLPRWNEV